MPTNGTPRSLDSLHGLGQDEVRRYTSEGLVQSKSARNTRQLSAISGCLRANQVLRRSM